MFSESALTNVRIFKVGGQSVYPLEFLEVKNLDLEGSKNEVMFCFLVLKKRKDNEEIPYTPE